ncbi:MAG: hypothetical protein HYY43_04710, partial [Deltaproteobacteria bacterium]|nr:hypothetical protein [Deltaproteobacteria bacterium]
MKYRPFIVIFICAVLAISCGGDSVSDSVIASAGGAWQSPEENLPINLQVDSGAQGIASSATPPRNDNAIAPSDQRTNAPDYSGKVVIKFKDGTDVRLRPEDRNGPFVSLAGADVSGVNEVVQRTRHPREGGDLDRAMEIPASAGMTRVTNITRVMTASEEEVSRWQEYWRKRGVTLHDWNLYYYLEVPEYEDARGLVGILSCHPCENR